MMGSMSYFQPFKHSGILSINSMAQLVILMTLFTASYLLLFKDSSSVFISIFLIMLTLAPLLAGVILTMQLPEDAIITGADDLLQDMAMTRSRGESKGKSRSPSDRSDSASKPDEEFKFANPMHRTSTTRTARSSSGNKLSQGQRNPMHTIPREAGALQKQDSMMMMHATATR